MLKDLLTRKTQWTVCMEETFDLITPKTNNSSASTRNGVMTTDTHPYHICNATLPQCNTGYVYMLILINDLNFAYIGIKYQLDIKYSIMILK